MFVLLLSRLPFRKPGEPGKEQPIISKPPQPAPKTLNTEPCTQTSRDEPMQKANTTEPEIQQVIISEPQHPAGDESAERCVSSPTPLVSTQFSGCTGVPGAHSDSEIQTRRTTKMFVASDPESCSIDAVKSSTGVIRGKGHFRKSYLSDSESYGKYEPVYSDSEIQEKHAAACRHSVSVLPSVNQIEEKSEVNGSATRSNSSTTFQSSKISSESCVTSEPKVSNAPTVYQTPEKNVAQLDKDVDVSGVTTVSQSTPRDALPGMDVQSGWKYSIGSVPTQTNETPTDDNVKSVAMSQEQTVSSVADQGNEFEILKTEHITRSTEKSSEGLESSDAGMKLENTPETGSTKQPASPPRPTRVVHPGPRTQSFFRNLPVQHSSPERDVPRKREVSHAKETEENIPEKIIPQEVTPAKDVNQQIEVTSWGHDNTPVRGITTDEQCVSENEEGNTSCVQGIYKEKALEDRIEPPKKPPADGSNILLQPDGSTDVFVSSRGGTNDSPEDEEFETCSEDEDQLDENDEQKSVSCASTGPVLKTIEKIPLFGAESYSLESNTENVASIESITNVPVPRSDGTALKTDSSISGGLQEPISAVPHQSIKSSSNGDIPLNVIQSAEVKDSAHQDAEGTVRSQDAELGNDKENTTSTEWKDLSDAEPREGSESRQSWKAADLPDMQFDAVPTYIDYDGVISAQVVHDGTYPVV